MEVIQELANQLGVAAESLLSAYAPYYLGQTIGEAILTFVMFVIMIIVVVISLNIMFKAYNNDYNSNTSELIISIAFTIAVIAGIISCLSFMIFYTVLPNAVGAIMSPQGAAIADIINRVTGVI